MMLRGRMIVFQVFQEGAIGKKDVTVRVSILLGKNYQEFQRESQRGFSPLC